MGSAIRLRIMSIDTITRETSEGTLTTYLYYFEGTNPDDNDSLVRLTMPLDARYWEVGSRVDLIV